MQRNKAKNAAPAAPAGNYTYIYTYTYIYICRKRLELCVLPFFEGSVQSLFTGSSVTALICCFKAASGLWIFVGMGDWPPALAFLQEKHTER